MGSGPSGKSVQESIDSASPLKAALTAGLEVIDENATVTFTLYNRVVLPADGFVFWVRADILNPSGLYASAGFSAAPFAGSQTINTPATSFDARGSLHRTTTNTQDEDANYSVQRIVFTSEDPVNELNDIAPGQLWIADWEPGLKFAFSSRRMFYQQAGLHHYEGDAVYSTLESQIIDSPSQLNQDLIISNSLPIWLTLQTQFPLYPSYLVPDNVEYPYGAVHIGEEDTRAIQPVAWRDPTNGSHWQLARDRVRVTTYGVKNNMMLDWLDNVVTFMTENPYTMGLMNDPLPRDAKRTQTEISAIAQKKVIEFEVSYYQQRIREQSLIYIKKAFITEIAAFVRPVGLFTVGISEIGQGDVIA